MEKRLRRVSDTRLPFVYMPKRYFRQNKKLLHDIQFMDKTKQPIRDKDMKTFLRYSERNESNQTIYNWILFHRKDIRVVDAGAGHIGEKGFYMDTNYDYDSLLFFLYYSEPDAQFSVQMNHPELIGQIVSPEMGMGMAEVFQNEDPALFMKVLNMLADKCEFVPLVKVLNILADKCEFVPLVICREDNCITVNQPQCKHKKATSGDAVLGHRALLRRLIASGYRMDTIDPKKDYYVIDANGILHLVEV